MSEKISFWAFITISAITPGPNNRILAVMVLLCAVLVWF